jgi:signal transduction histidine kinase
VREAAQRLRGLLFASVSHDLKSPLAGILGLCDLLEQEALLPEQRESLGLVKSRGRELLALIETILDATRVESGQLELLVRPGSLAELVEAASAKARDLTSDAACALRVHMPSELPDELRYDALHLPRALGAILGYALRVTSATAEPRVDLFCSAVPGWLLLTIEFGGPTSSELGDLLEREQASRGRGLTLGLSLARKIIELHGGEARVHAGGGARPRCVVRLPLALLDPG